MKSLKRLKSIITAIAIALSAMHLTTAPALAWVDCEGVKKTPLHKAIDAGSYRKSWYKKALKQIKPKYVNVLAQYKIGNRVHCYAPLHRIAFRDNASRELIEAFIAGGADVHAKDSAGLTPLHNAAILGSTETAQAFIAAGMDVNVQDENSSTPLHWSAWSSHSETALALITKGADVNAKDNDGDTPLHDAAYIGQTEIAQVLITAGANLEAKNNYGRTPLDVAVNQGRTETANVLRAAAP